MTLVAVFSLTEGCRVIMEMYYIQSFVEKRESMQTITRLLPGKGLTTIACLQGHFALRPSFRKFIALS